MNPSYDAVIREADIYDGTGSPPVTGDVAIADGRIVAIGAASGTARLTIDGRGKAVAPGFIDVHTHDDFAALVHPDMGFKLCGGVTTCIVGNCGMGVAPHAAAMAMAQVLHPRITLPEWKGTAGYVGHLDRNPPGVNIGVLVGHGTARLAAMGPAAREPDAREMDHMKATLQEGLDAGALGMSSGLVYDPGRHATTHELAELASLMRGTGALYATHMRDESDGLLGSVGGRSKSASAPACRCRSRITRRRGARPGAS